MGWIIPGLIVGGAIGWAVTYWYFHRDKIKAKIAAEYNKVTGAIKADVKKV